MAGIYRKYGLLSSEQIEKGECTREELIEGFIPIVLSVAGRFPTKYIERDEAISVGLIELIKCVDRNPVIKSAKQFAAYVKTSVHKRIKTHCTKWYGKSLIKSDPRYQTPIVTQVLTQAIPTKHYFEIELKDTIDAVVKDPIERVIINRVLEGGYKICDIAEELGVTRQSVGKLKEEILEKLLCELRK
jgi:RNA polymerase sigma factor (sigma-70 family)